jgi:hypothetical protein
MDLGTLDVFHLVPHRQIGRLELFGRDTFPHAFYSDSIVTKGESCALETTADGNGECTSLSTGPFHATRSEGRSKAGKERWKKEFGGCEGV